MPKVRVHNFAISVDGYAAGPGQSLEHPLGMGGTRLHEWIFAIRSGRRMIGEEGGDVGLDESFLVQGDAGIGATIIGGTTFHFVEDGIEVALQRALDAANGKDIRIGGGVATIQQYLRAGLIDNLHLAIVPTLLGSGERLFDGSWAGYECVEFVSSAAIQCVAAPYPVPLPAGSALCGAPR
jgi:hypothetical protein